MFGTFTKQTIHTPPQKGSADMLSDYPYLDEALKKLSVHQLTITEASAQYDLPKRVIYKALRQQQSKISQQKAYLLATQKRLQQNLQTIELELANLN